MKSHPGMKKFLFTREFHLRKKRVEFHSGMKFNLKENLPLSMIKTYNKISHFFSIIKIRSLVCKKQTINSKMHKMAAFNKKKIFTSIYIIYIIINIIAKVKTCQLLENS